MHDYRLTRDDGVKLDVDGGTWERALELAYLYGWKPAGTESPRTDGWRGRGPAPMWDAQDYFSQQAQHVGTDDACALATAVASALRQIPDEAAPRGRHTSPAPRTATSPMPSRASAVSEGLSPTRKGVLRRFAAFATRGGFTIAGTS